MKYVLLISLFMGASILHAQEVMNAYKYIIVPKKFEGFRSENQYQTSTLVKYLLTNHGFNAVYEDELPEDLNKNRCLGLLAQLLDSSSMFSTKAALLFKDCQSGEIFRTPEGVSKVKDFKGAYQEVLRDAFNVFNEYSYAYDPADDASQSATVNFDNDVRTVEENLPFTSAPPDNTTVISVTTPQDQRYENRKPTPSAMRKAAEIPSESDQVNAAGEIWYAQPIPNGYQLVDNTPSVRMKIYTSSLPDVFIATGDATSGLIYKKDAMWIYEFLEDGRLQTRNLTLKF